MIGQRLKLARAAAGLSLRGLEEKIGNRVTAQAIGKYERNESMPSSGVLIALASALDVSEDYLVGDQEMVLEGIEFRKKKITGKREEAQVEAQVLHLLERYLMIEELLHLPSVEWDRPREAPYPVRQSLGEADRAAASLRDHWGLGVDPIPNLVELLEEHGIKVLAIDLTNIDGLTARVRRSRKGAVPVIVVNGKDWGERQRFTLAHELGHMVMDVADGVDEEKAAHRFAGAFLMPADALWSEIGKHRTSISGKELIYLKRLFGVSIQAITYRCKDLGIFSEPLFRRLFQEFNRLGWRSPPYKEPEILKAEMPTRFKRLTFRALSEGAVSESKAAELLSVPLHALDALMDVNPPNEADAANGG
ncbi:XRE family transcriptional regulator [Parvibaculum sp.]|uniref:helix-turn-helix domain-containing protein n=1 Tax=Parvibaculum sp. TaxID=2024848 RepID=UPI000C544EB1|nr:XRE family transcriptional regulator [Parvibaculum sp.]MAM94927.1 transcriptional regulator [Parvibaculum sp.]